MGRTTDQLGEIAIEAGEKAFRGKQLAEWLYHRSARSIDEMTNLPTSFRRWLDSHCTHPLTEAEAASGSPDGTTKFLCGLRDGNKIECVFLPYENRATVCISTQAGCAMDCAFCATGAGGLIRDLSTGEIVDQVMLAQAATARRITNVVYMGMGEPLANYNATVASIRILNKEVGISSRRITVSTVGLPAAIRRLADEGLPLTLAISLHAPDDDLRAAIIPLARLNPLSDLLAACRHWIHKTGRRITFEYLLLAGVNDSPQTARYVAKVVLPLAANVNIIPYNYVEGRGQFSRPSRAQIERFKSEMSSAGVNVTERFRKGNPIDAACGQLRQASETGRKITRAND